MGSALFPNELLHNEAVTVLLSILTLLKELAYTVGW